MLAIVCNLGCIHFDIIWKKCEEVYTLSLNVQQIKNQPKQINCFLLVDIIYVGYDWNKKLGDIFLGVNILNGSDKIYKLVLKLNLGYDFLE